MSVANTTRPGPDSLRADARRNYERIVATAKEVFAERGADSSLEEIARRAGVGIGTLYRHFPNRDALLSVVMFDWTMALSTEAERLGKEYPPLKALELWLRGFVDYTLSYRGFASTLMGTLKDESSELYKTCHSSMKGGEALVKRAQDEGLIRSDLVAKDLFRLTHMIAIAAESTPEITDRLFSIVFEGAKAHHQAAATS
jgi:AcrR family transcriptional regulator